MAMSKGDTAFGQEIETEFVRLNFLENDFVFRQFTGSVLGRDFTLFTRKGCRGRNRTSYSPSCMTMFEIYTPELLLFIVKKIVPMPLVCCLQLAMSPATLLFPDVLVKFFCEKVCPGLRTGKYSLRERQVPMYTVDLFLGSLLTPVQPCSLSPCRLCTSTHR